MIADKELYLSENQNVTADAPSTNYINQGAAGDAYEQLFLVVKTNGATTSSDPNAKLDIKIQTDDVSNFSSAKVLASFSFALADLSANKEIIKVRLPLGLKKYIRLYYDVTTTTNFNGYYTAFLVKDVKI